MNLGEIVGGVAAAALLGLGAWHIARGILALRGTRLVTCPETGQPVAVDLDLPYSAVHSTLGRPHFRLKDCTRWPEGAGCGQICLGELEDAPHDCRSRPTSRCAGTATSRKRSAASTRSWWWNGRPVRPPRPRVLALPIHPFTGH